MTTVELLKTPDPISQNIIEFARNSASVLVVPKSVAKKTLRDFYEANSTRLRHFANDEDLSRETYKIRELNGSTWLQRTQYAISKLFGGISIGSDDYQASITWGATQSRFAVRDDSIGQLVRLDEDNLSASTLAKYFDLYSGLPVEHRPVFIIETHDTGSKINDRTSQVSDDFGFVSLNGKEKLEELIVARAPSQSLPELLEQYSLNSFSPGSRILLDNGNNPIFDGLAFHQKLAAKLIHLRSIANVKGKFSTIGPAKNLSSNLENIAKLESRHNEQKIALATKVFSNLWLLYCMEGPRDLWDNTMAIASSLDDKLMQAHCFRMINTVERHGAFSDQCSRQAAKIFHENELEDFASYCMNNALVGGFYTNKSVAQDFADLAFASSETIDGFLGVALIMNNAGVAHLIEGKYAQSIEWFKRAASQPSTTLHLMTIKINLAIALFLEGENTSDEELLKMARVVTRQIEPEYKYQIANMLMNLQFLAQGRRELEEQIGLLLIGTGLLDDDVVRTNHSTLESLATKLNFIKAETSVGIGRRAEFIERFGFVPIIHHAWL